MEKEKGKGSKQQSRESSQSTGKGKDTKKTSVSLQEQQEQENEEYASIEEYFLDCVRFEDDVEIAYCFTQKLEFDCVDKNLNNVLHIAAANGSTALLKQLIGKFQEKGLKKEINSKNSAGNTPLHWAV